MNCLRPGQSADYVNTGEWSTKAMKEASRFGGAREAGSSADRRFSYIPDFTLDPSARYFHITTNNTIEGTEWGAIPETGGIPLVADFSSDILARDLDYSRFSLFYAGAQKNAGPAGVTLVVARREFLAQANEEVPVVLSYETHLKNDSLYNTPPVFAIYVVGLVLKWIEEQGGLRAVGSRNREKAAFIYSALDSRPDMYEPAVSNSADRSTMNITFRLRDSSRDSAFLAGAEARGMHGLKGHRSVGGFRASIYNAFPVEGARALADYLQDFE